MLSLDRCLVYTGSNYIDIKKMELQSLSGLDRFAVYSGFGLDKPHCIISVKYNIYLLYVE